MARSLNSISFFLLSLVVGSLTNDETEPRKIPTVAGILDKVLSSFEENGLSIPEINLGEDVGRVSDIRAEATGKFEKVVKAVKTYGFDLKLSAEKIKISGFYDVQNIDLPGLFPVFGKGDFSVELEELNVEVRIDVTRNFVTEKFDTKIINFSLSLKESKVKFNNLMNDPDLADFLNELISSLIPDLIHVLHGKVVPILEPLVGYVMSGVIDCIKKETKVEKLEECIKNLTRISYDLPQIVHFQPNILTSFN